MNREGEEKDGSFNCIHFIDLPVNNLQRSAMMMAAFFEAVVCVICCLFVSLNTLVFFV